MIARSSALSTVNVAVFDVAPVPPFVEVTVFVVLLNVPAAVGVTLTVTVQVPPTAMVPLLKFKTVSPGNGENVGVPQLVVPGWVRQQLAGQQEDYR